MAAGFAPKKSRKRRKKNTLAYAIGGGFFVVLVGAFAFLMLRDTTPNSGRKVAGEASEVARNESNASGQVSSDLPSTDEIELSAPRPLGFTGRYRLGPDKAAIRVVAITDYQCPACRNVEASLQDLLRRYDSMSLSIKHFPACRDCNDRFLDNDVHPNACRAACAAEAAGLLWGNEGFWKLHDWLFENHGQFTLNELRDEIRTMGRDTSKFMKLVEDERTLAYVKEDIEEAVALGLQFTPMVFINGVELKGTQARDAVVRAIDALAAEDLPAMTAEADTPPPAPDRYLTAWREQPARLLPTDDGAIKFGNDGAKLRVVMWGDYEDALTARADIMIRKLLAGRSDAQYVFRHFPVNTGCNEMIRDTQHPFACMAARAVVSAQLLRGDEAARRMHIWMMEHSDELNDVSLKLALKEMGFDGEQFTLTMQENSVAAAINADIEAAREVGLSNTPWIYVNDRKVARFMGEGDAILRLIFAEAVGQ